jgi:hypothetical protein
VNEREPSGFETQLANALAGAGTRADCPGAEVLAAFAEGTLREEARTACEEHVSRCSRCQAVLALAMDEVPAVAEVVPFAPRSARPAWRRAVWLAPVGLAASAVLAIWLGRVAPEEARTPSPGAAAIADAPSPARPPDAGSEQVAAGRADEATPPVLRDETRAAESAKESLPAGEDGPSRRTFEPRRQERAARDTVAPSSGEFRPAPPATPEAVGAAAATEGAAPAPPSAPPADAASLQAGSEKTTAAPRARAEADRNGPSTFVSPSGRTVWRLPAEGGVEGILAGTAPAARAAGAHRFLAGAAVSDSIAWAVGEHGTVWRTVDGRAWSPVPSPTTDNLVAVTVESADAAAVVTRAGVRFETRDGGRTWRRATP